MKKIFLLLSVFFISNSLFAATNDKHIFYLDNPTTKNIEITLDNKVYKLKPKTYEVLNLKMGQHIAELSDGTKVYFKIFANSKGGIINPSGATYTINYFRYQSPRICVDWSEPEDTVLLTFDDFIIDKNYIAWEYDIFEEVTRESMPKKLSPEVDIYVFTKIYSPSEFKDIDYDIEKPKANLPKIDSDYNIPNNEDKTFQNYIKQIINLDKTYKDTNDAKKQKKILKEYDKIAKIIWSEYPKYNIAQGSYDNVDLKALNLKSLDRGVIITKIEDDLNDRKR
ncbi:hypothetical protein RO03_11660 [Fusobacterium nucleatum subsp. nucleatum]|uniref:PEGA domain-containing protein n=2 Tax=Fusobacterium nucleatum TaxID=851 RepID=A0A101K510_FUSNC|nr:hypothetical protein [Fusobacterium nucleatum]ALF23302.1 hypothetical protein RO05_02485 [Fusobacterium nucleatum subsp. nucleatum ChDC F316]KUL97644.1 hypothetical protein RO03_11660 [Fusobacterium nucleatum subsp. nucleatum]WMS29170.1 hypothetical protein RDV57_08690 [Fusobacterium nucleatum]